MLRTFIHVPCITATVCMLFVAALSAAAQDEVRLFDATVRGNAMPGYYLMAPTNNEKLGFVDHGGWVLHRSPARSPLNLQRHPDGTFTYFVPLVGHIRMDAAFAVAIDTIRASQGGTDFHEVKVLANGNYLVLSASPRRVDMSKLVQGGIDTATVLDAVVEEIEPDGDVVWRWNSKDHASILDVTRGIDLQAPSIDYIHVNSLHVDADNNILISMRNFDEIGKIDRITGAFKWRLGGTESKNNQFTWLNDTVDGFRGFSRQHSIVRTAPDRIMIMDNGGLKPTEYSRAVEYEINEVAKTVRRVWQYRPTPDVYARVMGSVDRLPNGGTLIGWGQNVARMALTELDSNGAVVYELRNAPGVNVSSYRVGKYPVKMTAARRRITSTGLHAFVSGDSTTGAAVRTHRLASARNITIERHRIGPLGATYVGASPAVVEPLRWTIRHDLAPTDSASLILRLADISAIRDPQLAVIWHRPLEGTGAFERQSGTVDRLTGTVTLSDLRSGEYIVAYDVGHQPNPVAPDSAARRIGIPVDLRWRRSIAADSFTVQIDTSPSFQGSPRTLLSTDTTIRLVDLVGLTSYWWRVRAWQDATPGPWSRVMEFRTALPTPVIITPRQGAVLEPEAVTVTWRRVPSATSYRVRASDGQGGWERRTSDTTITIDGIHGDADIEIDVTSERDGDTSVPMTPLRCMTLPHRPTELAPAPGAVSLTAPTLLRWRRISGVGVHVQCTSFDGLTTLVDDTTTADSIVVSGVEPGRLYRWRVRALGTKGHSGWTRERSFATSGSPLRTAPTLISPENGAVVDGDAASLRWSMDDACTHSLVQIADDPGFADPIVDTIVAGLRAADLSRLPADRPLIWRVYGTNGGDLGQWSGARQFTVTGTGLGPIAPPKGAMNVPTLGEVSYTTNARYSEYRVEFFVDGNDSVPEHIYASTTGRCRYLGLYPATLYTWHVVGLTNDGERDVGASSTFRTSPTLDVKHVDNHVRVTYIHGVLEVKGPMSPMDECFLIDLIGRRADCPVTLISDSELRYRVPGHVQDGMYFVVITRNGHVWSVSGILLQNF